MTERKEEGTIAVELGSNVLHGGTKNEMRLSSELFRPIRSFGEFHCRLALHASVNSAEPAVSHS